MVVQIVKNFFGLFYGIVAIFRKLLCFLNIKKGRRNSGSILPLHTDVKGAVVQQSLPSNDHTDMEMESWESWGGEQDGFMSAAVNHTHQNPQSGFHGNRKSSADSEEEVEVDYFQDMIPQVKKQPKIFVRKKEMSQWNDGSYKSEGFSKRLTLNSEVPLNDDPDLGAWEETENAWGDELSEDLSWEAKSAIKERKRVEREQRQQEQLRKKQEREKLRTQKPASFSAVKLS